MTRAVTQARQFKKDMKKISLDTAHMDRLKLAVTLLAQGEPLPTRMRDHELIGEYKGYRECHIAPDLLLIYKQLPDELRLARLGTHSELFR